MEEYFAIYLAYANGVTQKSSQYVVLIYIYTSQSGYLDNVHAIGWVPITQRFFTTIYNYRRTEGQKDRRTELKVVLHRKPVATSVSGCGTFTIH